MILSNNKYDYFVMVGPGSDYGNQMWKDVATIDNCLYSNNVLNTNNSFIRFLHHAHFSFAINKTFPLPFKCIWNRKYYLSTISFDNNKKYCVILTDISACRMSVSYLKKLSQKPNVDMVLVNVNVFDNKKSLLSKRISLFDKIYSFDKNDCQKYGFIHYARFYSYNQLSLHCQNEIYDALFVGYSKGRDKLLSNIADKIVSHGLKPCFYIVDVKKKDCVSKNVIYNKKINYEKVLSLSNQSKCLIEVISNNQEGSTLRFVEAVCLNKLLMTNNQNIKNDPFYKSGNISVFTNLNDFDVSFLKSKKVLPYNYNGEFSPINFLKELCK